MELEGSSTRNLFRAPKSGSGFLASAQDFEAITELVCSMSFCLEVKTLTAPQAALHFSVQNDLMCVHWRIVSRSIMRCFFLLLCGNARIQHRHARPRGSLPTHLFWYPPFVLPKEAMTMEKLGICHHHKKGEDVDAAQHLCPPATWILRLGIGLG